MHAPTRMSPLTAFFLGLFGVGAVAVASGTVVLLFGLRMVDRHIGVAIHLAENAVTNLPEFLEGLPPALKDALHDRRAPEYAAHLEAEANIVDGGGQDRFVTLTVRNAGEELVSLLSLRVAALDAQGRAVREWTTVAATPIGIEDEWRGPLMPGGTRHIVLDRGCFFPGEWRAAVTAVVEIADVRVWRGSESERQASVGYPG